MSYVLLAKNIATLWAFLEAHVREFLQRNIQAAESSATGA